MKFSKNYIDELAKETGFRQNNLEKFLRLFEVLDFIFSKSSFAEYLALKGGTAINLTYDKLKRLSVDIDLDYHHSLDKEQVEIDREKIFNELDVFMYSQNYALSPKSRKSAILKSNIYYYTNIYGNKDTIKIEINFIDRISIFPSKNEVIKHFGFEFPIVTLKKEELFGMKIAALIQRSKPRDLFDTDELFKIINTLDKDFVRKCAIFYLSLDSIFTIDASSYDRIKDISQVDVIKELLPVISKKQKYSLETAKRETILNLENLLQLSLNEKKYLEEFSKGNYEPSLLFSEQESLRASKHPMAKRIILNINKNN